MNIRESKEGCINRKDAISTLSDASPPLVVGEGATAGTAYKNKQDKN
jgi:hypothetical protein